MHSDLTAALAGANEQELRDKATRHRLLHTGETAEAPTGADVVIRAATAADGPQLAALAELDEAAPPIIPALVAEVCGKLAAVLPLDGGRAYSDPFRPTAELVQLLELRARQIASAGWTPHTRFRWPAPPVLRRFAR